MKLYLVRHPNYANPDQVHAYHLPVKLSEDGIAKAKRIGEWFKRNDNYSLPIYSSPIVRTFETATIIAQLIGSKVNIDNRLIETYCPNLQGKKQPEDEDEAWQLECKDPSRESTTVIQKRMLDIYQEIEKIGNDCILVSHGDPLTALLYYFMDRPVAFCLFDDKHFDVFVKRGEVIEIDTQTKSIKRFDP